MRETIKKQVKVSKLNRYRIKVYLVKMKRKRESKMVPDSIDPDVPLWCNDFINSTAKDYTSKFRPGNGQG